MDQQDQLREFLSDVRRRWFADEALRVIGRSAAAAAVPALCASTVYWFLGPSGGALVLLAVLTIAASIAAGAIVAVRMQPRPDDAHVARFVEERAAALPGVPAFEDALVTAVESSLTADAAFRPLLVSVAVKRLAETTPSQIVPPERLRTAALHAAAGLTVFTVALLVGIGPLGRAFETAWILFYPNALTLEVLPGDSRVLAGQPLAVRAVVRSGDRLFTRLVPTLTVSAGQQQRTVPMTAEGEGFAFAIESVDRSFRYRVSAGAAVSQEYTVEALFAPRVERIELQYEFPSFTGLRARGENDGGDLYGPAGTRVRIRVHVDKPVASGEMVFAGGAQRPFVGASDQVLEGEIVLTRDDSYRLRLADRDGLTAEDDTEYFIRLMDDRPPDVRIMRPAGDQQITPLEEVAIEARAEDDHGVASLDLVYSVAGGEPRAVPFQRTSGTDVIRLGAHVLAAEQLRVKPGDVITYYARARDVGRGKRPTEARSDMYFLEVRPFGEEFVAAESQGGGGASSQQLESLIAAQKEIINATWNIERRSGAGRSTADVRAVAQAQAELKARTEQMTSPRGRGRFQAPQQVAPTGRRSFGQGGGGDPIANALAAMARAVEQLQGERTKEALPHEMNALQALLQAQAEVRRREVRQQANSGSGAGSGRPGEDLSALFDKELQRQQRTNYETRSGLDERSDRRDESDAFDRIRDLARRQEGIDRRLRELAQSKESDEERKRQLEQLTREQKELTEQIEQLAQKSSAQGDQQADSKRAQGQRDSTGGQSRQDPQARGSASQMKQAAEHMRGAAGDLEKADVEGAAREAQRAAERLRGIEQQMRGSSPEARRRAAGELQLEAQQIAQEQRRIAAEAERLDKGEGAGNADARRRLSGEKDQLADRVDGLQRGASAAAKGQENSGVAAAARELERQQIGGRMRETAKQLRQGAGSTAPAERQLADALERVVQQFGGDRVQAGEGGSLDQTRAIRNRLDGLERQIAEASQQAQQGRGGNDGGKTTSTADEKLSRLREEYGRALQQARETLTRMQQSAPGSGVGGSTPEKHEWSRADPGNQGFKQDFSAWEGLRKDINLALERTEAAASAQAAKEAAQDRLSAGGSSRVPDEYQKLIARYFESLARPRR